MGDFNGKLTGAQIDALPSEIAKKQAKLSAEQIANIAKGGTALQASDMATVNGQSLVNGGNIVIQGGSGGSEPSAYIKDASVSGNTLTLTKKDNTTVEFAPAGGGASDADAITYDSTKEAHTSGSVGAKVAQLDLKMGELTSLNTAAKSNLVSAINEAAQSGYQKPTGGIPKTDLASDVQTSLGKADSALQSHQDISGKQDKMISANALPAGQLVDGTKYVITSAISALNLTVNTIPTDNSKGILIYFSTPSGGCTLTYPSATNWIGADAPSVEASKKYVMLIANGVCGIIEYNPQTA